MNEFLEQFLLEARELVDQTTVDLLALERTPSDRESLDGAFRGFHTLKGGAAIVDFAAMMRVVHAIEEILSAVRDGDRPMTPALISDCLACLDQVVEWLDTIQETGELPNNAEAAADRLAAHFTAESQNSEDATPLLADAQTSPDISPQARALLVLREQLLLVAVPGEGAEGRMASAARLTANTLRHLGRRDEAEGFAALSAGSLGSLEAANLIGAIEAAIDRLVEVTQPKSDGKAATSHDSLPRTLRIDAERVGALVNLTGELTVAKNALGHIAMLAQQSDNALAAAIKDEHGKLDRLIGALQRAVLELRVLPLRVAFRRFSRLVREMAESLAKPTRLTIEGDDTEADRTIVEMLSEPLLHVVRNAMDHGVEPASERASAGKPIVATIHIRARREGEHVMVEVEDDGRGIDPSLIRRVAAERGLLTAEALSALSEEEVIDLIFAPGFSTASQITGLSGRGVGMDVVRASVERLGGRVLVETRLGAGSTVRLVLPFSAMITRVLTVEAGGQKFGIPLDAVIETVRVPREEIHPVGRAQAFVLRERTVPLVELGRTLGWSGAQAAPLATIVVMMIGGLLGGLEVDRLGERMDVMLKPREGLLSGLPEIAGTTVLGDGSILLILDLKEVLR
jgi:two-component system chemotaxis sensor kinase CheA